MSSESTTHEIPATALHTEIEVNERLWAFMDQTLEAPETVKRAPPPIHPPGKLAGPHKKHEPSLRLIRASYFWGGLILSGLFGFVVALCVFWAEGALWQMMLAYFLPASFWIGYLSAK